MVAFQFGPGIIRDENTWHSSSFREASCGPHSPSHESMSISRPGVRDTQMTPCFSTTGSWMSPRAERSTSPNVVSP